MPKKLSERWQKGRIHQLAAIRGMNREQYEDALAEWGVSSSKQLTYQQANNVIAMWKRAAIREGKYTPPDQKYEHLKDRPRYWPSPGQLRLLDAMWNSVSQAPRSQRAEALNTFLYNRFGIPDIEQVPRSMVQKIKKTLDAMKGQQHGKANTGANTKTQRPTDQIQTAGQQTATRS